MPPPISKIDQTIEIALGALLIALIIRLILFIGGYPGPSFQIGLGLLTGFFLPGLMWSPLLGKDTDDRLELIVYSLIFSIILMAIGVSLLNALGIAFKPLYIWEIAFFWIISGALLRFLKK